MCIQQESKHIVCEVHNFRGVWGPPEKLSYIFGFWNKGTPYKCLPPSDPAMLSKCVEIYMLVSSIGEAPAPPAPSYACVSLWLRFGCSGLIKQQNDWIVMVHKNRQLLMNLSNKAVMCVSSRYLYHRYNDNMSMIRWNTSQFRSFFTKQVPLQNSHRILKA